jgi:hypothetical protein
MSENDDALINKIVSFEAEFVKIYTEMYSLLPVDRQGLESRQLAGLKTLKDPREIEPSEAVAVLKSISVSIPGEKLQLEHLYPVKLRDNKGLLGNFVRNKLNAIRIGSSDLRPYLRARDWIPS